MRPIFWASTLDVERVSIDRAQECGTHPANSETLSIGASHFPGACTHCADVETGPRLDVIRASLNSSGGAPILHLLWKSEED